MPRLVSFLHGVLCSVLFEDHIELMVPVLDSLEIAVGVEGIVLYLDDGHGDVGAVVGDALIVVEQIGEDEALFDGAHALLEALDVPVFHLGGELVDDLFQRFHPGGKIYVAGLVGFYGHVQDLVDGFDEVIQLVLCLFGEGQALVVDLLGHAHQVHSVVAQALEVAHGVEHLGDDVGVALGQSLSGELD